MNGKEFEGNVLQSSPKDKIAEALRRCLPKIISAGTTIKPCRTGSFGHYDLHIPPGCSKEEAERLCDHRLLSEVCSSVTLKGDDLIFVLQPQILRKTAEEVVCKLSPLKSHEDLISRDHLIDRLHVLGSGTCLDDSGYSPEAEGIFLLCLERYETGRVGRNTIEKALSRWTRGIPAAEKTAAYRQNSLLLRASAILLANCTF